MGQAGDPFCNPSWFGWPIPTLTWKVGTDKPWERERSIDTKMQVKKPGDRRRSCVVLPSSSPMNPRVG